MRARILCLCVVALGACMDARAQVSPGGAVTGSSARPTFQGATIKNAAPTLEWYETDAAANNRRWQGRVNAEKYQLGVLTDAGTFASWLDVDRTANTVDAIALTSTALTWNGSNILTAASGYGCLSCTNSWSGVNTFANNGTAGAVRLTSQSQGGLMWTNTFGGTDIKKWYLVASDSSWSLQTMQDNEAGGEQIFTAGKLAWNSTSFNVSADEFNYKGNPVAVYANTTSNFTGTLQHNGNTVLTTATTGMARYADATANFTGTLQQGGVNVCTTSSCVTTASAVKLAGGVVDAAGALSGSVRATGASRSATGVYDIDLTAAGFSSAPVCTATLLVSNEDGNVYADVGSVTAVQVRTKKHDDSYVNQAFNFVCIGL